MAEIVIFSYWSSHIFDIYKYIIGYFMRMAVQIDFRSIAIISNKDEVWHRGSNQQHALPSWSLQYTS